MTLAKQIDQWHRAGEHEATVQAILQLTDADVTDDLTEDLAVAYNNMGQYQKAIEALQTVDSQNRTSPHWHYCMGYALYYSAMDSPTREKQRALFQGAFDAFSCALRLNPEPELEAECREFLAWIKEDADSAVPSGSSRTAMREGAFVCSVLLAGAWFDREKFIRDFYTDWSLRIKTDEDTGADMVPNGDAPPDGPSLAFFADNLLAAITLIPAPIPGQEVEMAASCNYLWPNAWKVAQRHRAHLLITVLDTQSSLSDRGRLLVKLASTCCLQLSAIGVFTGGAVYQVGLYRNLSTVMRDGRPPVFNWIWFGLYKSCGGISGYTCGLELFGKDEIEISDTDMRPDRLRNFLVSLAFCALEEHAVFQDGDTVGMEPEQKLPVIRSKGVALSGMTVKIPAMAQDGFRKLPPAVS